MSRLWLSERGLFCDERIFEYISGMKNIHTSWLIHGFAVLHAIATISCTLLGFKDSLLLTLLTMAMTILICYKENLTVEITISSIVLVNILGFLLGNLGALFILTISGPYGNTHSLHLQSLNSLAGACTDLPTFSPREDRPNMKGRSPGKSISTCWPAL